MLREQQDPPCDTKEEQYQPTSVQTVLGNPTVTLTREERDGRLVEVKKAPTAADIAGLPDGRYLDYEGKVARRHLRLRPRLPQAGRGRQGAGDHLRPRRPRIRATTGFALQYWFFWYFNQFNDLHEGDWEGMQITFEADTAAEALEEEPGEIILFQHAGGERAEWEAGKAQKEGTHPIVYPAAGSHATFYDSAVYVENGQNGSGVGCDNTSEPLRELQLRPVLLPETAPEDGRLPVAQLPRPLGRTRKGVQQRPARAGDEDGLARTVRLDGEAAHDQPALPGRLGGRAGR